MSLFHKFLQRLMSSVALLVTRRAAAIVVISIILGIGGAYECIFHFDVASDTSDLLSNNSPQKQDFNKLEDDFGSDARFIVLIQSPDVAKNRQMADQVGDYLRTLSPQVSTVLAKIDFTSIKPRLLFLEELPKLNRIADKVEKEAKAAQASGPGAKIALDLNSFLEQAKDDFKESYLRDAKNYADFNPFVDQFVSVLIKASKQAEGAAAAPDTSTSKSTDDDDDNVDVDEQLAKKEYFATDDGKSLLVLAYTGVQEVNSDTPFSNTVAKIREKLKIMEQDNPNVEIHLTGEPALDADQIAAANSDTLHAACLTLCLIIGLFAVSYRTLMRPLFTFLSLIVAVLWSLGFSLATVGHFNILSIAVIPMVLGIGIDFGIQILGRYEEELNHGATVEGAIKKALEHTGIAIITGGSTTAAAFFTLCFNDFIGLSELGDIAGISMILCMTGALLLLPSLFFLWDRNVSLEKLKERSSQKAWSFLANWDRDLVRIPWVWLGVSAVLTLLSIFSIHLLTFDYNLLHLQSDKAQSVKILRKVMDATRTDNGNEISTIYASIVTDNLDEARRLSDKLLECPEVAKVDSILELLPADQEAKLPVIKRIVAAAASLDVAPSTPNTLDIPKARADVADLLEQTVKGEAQAHGMSVISKTARLAEAAFSKLIPALRRLNTALTSNDNATLAERFGANANGAFSQLDKNLKFLKTQVAEPIQIDDLPETFRDLYLSKDAKKPRQYLLQVFGKEDLWEHEPDARFVKAVLAVAPNATGTPILNCYATDLLITSYLQAALWAFVAIVALILLHFQSFKYLLLTITPLILAVLWRSGVMVLAGIAFNPANIVTLPLIIGIDVAFGIYIVDRFREDGEFRIFSESTGKAIIMSAMTSFFGFVSLLVAEFRGVYSIGVLMSLGIAIGLVTSIFILPQILVLLPKKEPVKKA